MSIRPYDIFLTVLIVILFGMVIYLIVTNKRKKEKKLLFTDDGTSHENIEASTRFQDLYIADARYIDASIPYIGKFIVTLMDIKKEISLEVVNSTDILIGDRINISNESPTELEFRVESETDSIILRSKTSSSDIILKRLELEIC